MENIPNEKQRVKDSFLGCILRRISDNEVANFRFVQDSFRLRLALDTHDKFRIRIYLCKIPILGYIVIKIFIVLTSNITAYCNVVFVYALYV